METTNIPYQRTENKTGEIIIRSLIDRQDTLKRIQQDTFTSILVQDNGYRKSIIFQLAIHNIPFTSINFGAGVYRIIKEEKMIAE